MIYIYLLLSNFIWGCNIVVTKINSQYYHPLFLVFIKMTISLIISIVILMIKKEKLKKISIKEIFINSQYINTLNFALTYIAIGHIQGQGTSIINCLSPLFMSIHQKVYYYKIYFFIFLILLFYFYNVHFTMYYLYLIIALYLYTLGQFKAKKLNISILLNNFYMFLISWIEYLIVLFFINNPVKQFHLMYLIIYIFTSGLGYFYIQIITFYGFKCIGILKTSFILSFAPVFSYLLSIVFLDEKLNFIYVFTFIFILLCSLLLVKLNHTNSK